MISSKIANNCKSIALWIGIILNCALIGYLGTRAAGQSATPSASTELRAGAPFLGIMDLETLDVDERVELRTFLRQNMPDIRAARRASDEAQAEFQRIFSTEDFDPETARSAMKRVSEARARQYELAVGIFIEVFDQLPRDAQLEVLERRSLHGPDLHGRRGQR